MSKCTRRVMKATEETYIKCDKCGKDITKSETMSKMLIGPRRLFVRNKIEQIIFDPSGFAPEQRIEHDLCLDCYKEFLNWLGLEED